MNRAVEVRTPSDGFAATFPKGDGFYPDKLKFVAQLTARALNYQLSTVRPGIGVALRPARALSFQSSTKHPGIGVATRPSKLKITGVYVAFRFVTCVR